VSATFRTEIFTGERFSSAEQLSSYLGLCPDRIILRIGNRDWYGWKSMSLTSKMVGKTLDSKDCALE
jgi:hypothetical protein